MEDDLWWKMTFGGRRPLVEDKLRFKTTFWGRQPLVEDNLCWKTTFGGRQPSVKDDLWWKTTCSGRRPSAEDDLYWILACCLLRFAAFFENILNFMYHFLGTAGLSKVSHQSPVCPPLDPWSPPRAPPQKKSVLAIMLDDVIYGHANMIMIKVYFCTPQLYFGAYILIRG